MNEIHLEILFMLKQNERRTYNYHISNTKKQTKLINLNNTQNSMKKNEIFSFYY